MRHLRIIKSERVSPWSLTSNSPEQNDYPIRLLVQKSWHERRMLSAYCAMQTDPLPEPPRMVHKCYTHSKDTGRESAKAFAQEHPNSSYVKQRQKELLPQKSSKIEGLPELREFYVLKLLWEKPTATVMWPNGPEPELHSRKSGNSRSTILPSIREIEGTLGQRQFPSIPAITSPENWTLQAIRVESERTTHLEEGEWSETLNIGSLDSIP